MAHSNFGFLLIFLEEMYAKNTANIFITPMGPGHYLMAQAVMSLLRILAAISLPIVVCLFLYQYNLFSMGLALIPFAISLLVFAWSLGMVAVGLVMRYGYAMEPLAWMTAFALAPFSCVFYPLEAMPSWLQPFCQLLPTTHIFEGMRAVLDTNHMPWAELGRAFGLNIVFIGVCSFAFFRLFRSARQYGTLLTQNE